MRAVERMDIHACSNVLLLFSAGTTDPVSSNILETGDVLSTSVSSSDDGSSDSSLRQRH